MNILEILKIHAKKYPLMRPCDAVKLIYQNEFGGGHLIRSAEESFERLKNEYTATPHDDTVPLYESIGGGVVRVNLTSLDTDVYPLEKLNRDFVRSSAEHTGSSVSFLMKLAETIRNFDSIGFSFTIREFSEYLDAYKRDGYPAVSHSKEYRDAYTPAYRVVCEKYIKEQFGIANE